LRKDAIGQTAVLLRTLRVQHLECPRYVEEFRKARLKIVVTRDRKRGPHVAAQRQRTKIQQAGREKAQKSGDTEKAAQKKEQKKKIKTHPAVRAGMLATSGR